MRCCHLDNGAAVVVPVFGAFQSILPREDRKNVICMDECDMPGFVAFCIALSVTGQ